MTTHPIVERPTGTVTFLFTDLEGSTRLWEEHPEEMREALARHDAILRAAIEGERGFVFKTVGDAFCAAFGRPEDALRAAVAAQHGVTAEPWEAGVTLQVRMALHTGQAHERDSDYFGPAVNRVARLLAAGHGGQVLVSQAAAALLAGILPERATLDDLGPHELKDLAQPERIYLLGHPDLPDVRAPLRSLQAFAHNLPSQLTSFVGREREVDAVRRMLSHDHQPATRLLTLTGSGGTGKTRLGLQAAADLLDAYPDGAWLVELAPLSDPALVEQAIAAVLGVREEAGRPLAATLVAHLKARELLLLLDNCEHLLAATAALADTLLRGCGHVRILATSREPLGVPGEQTYPVPSLSLPPAGDGFGRTLSIYLDPASLGQYEAVRLFIERASLSHPSFAVTPENAGAVVEVCRHLDGIPFAIELAAARVKSLPIEGINERLHDRFRLLTGGSRSALPRQQTLRAMIDWSYDLASEAEQTLLRRLSVFSGGWSLEAAEEVCSGGPIEPWEVLDLLTALVDKSLVVYDAQEGTGDPDARGRYRLLETIAHYARERFHAEEDTETLRGQHLLYFAGLAEGIANQSRLPGPLSRELARQLEREHDNLRAALDWGLGSGVGVEPALHLAPVLSRFWLTAGYFSEGRRWMERALPHRHSVPDALRLRVLNGSWALAHFQGDQEAARSLAEEALAVGRAAGNPFAVSFALFQLGLQAADQRDAAAAATFGEEGLALARAEGNTWLVSRHVVLMGRAAWERGDLAAAQAYLEEGLSMSRSLGDRWNVGMVLAHLGYLAQLQGDQPLAVTLHHEGVSLWAEVKDRRGLAWHLDGLADATGEAQPRHAAHLMGAAEQLLEVSGATLLPCVEAYHTERREQVKAALGQDAFIAALTEGRGMTADQAASCALDVELPR